MCLLHLLQSPLFSFTFRSFSSLSSPASKSSAIHQQPQTSHFRPMQPPFLLRRDAKRKIRSMGTVRHKTFTGVQASYPHHVGNLSYKSLMLQLSQRCVAQQNVSILEVLKWLLSTFNFIFILPQPLSYIFVSLQSSLPFFLGHSHTHSPFIPLVISHCLPWVHCNTICLSHSPILSSQPGPQRFVHVSLPCCHFSLHGDQKLNMTREMERN